ncbi:MAG: M23 family metallopeptidase [Candidatus Doudnabacteria bacterium]
MNKNKQLLCAKIFTLSASLGLILVPFGVYAAAPQDIAAEKAAKQKQLQQLEQQIKDYQGQIQQKRSQAASLGNEISLYDTEIKATEVKVEATQTNIDNTQLQITETKTAIEQKNLQIAQEKVLLSELLLTLQQYDNTSTIQIGLGSSNFSDFMDQVQYTQQVSSKVYSLLQQIKEIKAKLEKDQQALETNLNQLKQLSDQLDQTQSTLNDQKSSKVVLLTQTHGQESRYKKLLVSTQDEEQRINKEIYDLDNQAKGSKARKGLPSVNGILAWPMDGVVTQGYGNTGFTKLGYSFHNGIDLAGPAGTSIYSAADGVVVGTGRAQAAYGNWVAIKHKAGGKLDRDIVTLYAHMIKFVVSRGQSVAKGDLVGYEGNTGNTSRLLYGPDRGYHLHFTVFDADGFGIKDGAYPATYGPYQIPYGFTYNPRNFF